MTNIKLKNPETDGDVQEYKHERIDNDMFKIFQHKKGENK